ncbi:MAG: sigma-70 family RNA polymerase sigma factor [Nibricoccus sp.]
MSDDGELLRRFAETRDQACFEKVVQRYIGFVFAISLRRLQDQHLAQDATQAVFIALARKATRVSHAPSVMGWLHRSACYETKNLMRAQRNRIARETEAARLGTAEPAEMFDVGQIKSVLDEALGELSERDREAVLARFFSGQSFGEIGTKLKLSENAARMRVERALSKLRDLLQRKGITCTAAALAGGLPAYASTPVPATVVAAVTSASVACVIGAAIPGTLFFMSTAKIVTSVAAIAVIAGFIYQHQETARLAAEVATLRGERIDTAKQLQAIEKRLDAAPVSQRPESRNTEAVKVLKQATNPESIAVPGVTPKAPSGWIKNGSATDLYEVGVDENNSWGGMPSAYAKSTGAADGKFGGMMQTISAEAYKSQRVQLTGWIKTEDASDGGGHLWMRVDGSERGQMLAFDNMEGRAPKGTTDWQEYSIVLDVPADATSLNYGFFVNGRGKMWVNGVTITPVGSEVPATNMLAKAKKALPQTPVNLGFAPNRTQ